MELFIQVLVVGPLTAAFIQWALLHYAYQVQGGLGVQNPAFLLLRLGWLLLLLAPTLVILRDAFAGHHTPDAPVFLIILALLVVLVYHASRYVLFAYSESANKGVVLLLGVIGSAQLASWHIVPAPLSSTPDAIPISFMVTVIYLCFVGATWISRMRRNRTRDLYLAKSAPAQPPSPAAY